VLRRLCLTGLFVLGLAGCSTTNADFSMTSETVLQTTSIPRTQRAITDALLPELPATAGPATTAFSLDQTPDVTGAVSLTDAAQQVTDASTESAVLTGAGYNEGFSRGWSAPSGDVISLTTYAFSSADSAKAYGAKDYDREVAEGAAPLVNIDFGQLKADAVWTTGSEYSAKANGVPWRTLTVTFTIDNRWYQVTTGGPIEANGPAVASRDLVNSLALAQLGRATTAP